MHIKFLVAILSATIFIAGCATTSSSNTVEPTTASNKWDGPVFVSTAALPAEVKYTVIGTVQADAKAGYSGEASLYPFLAAEARKIGANAVINPTGGRRVTAFSWAAAYVSGTAVKVDDPEKLKGLPGSTH